ncbi:hypothetical protein [Kitasatospora indigofera]|uniref:hypothetical protein n=1 Tax=Kitasatospora indigofera TaxID=67307 RepID=UPI00367910C8
MNLHDLLQSEADDLKRDFQDHDPTAFTRRLAQRIADGEGSPSARALPRSDRAPATARRQAPAAREDHRRPLPETLISAGAGRGDLHRDLVHLCRCVVTQADLGELAGFVPACDEAAATAFGCLLYGIGRIREAVFWWRFAAGAGDCLAVHCLAVHYAVDGTEDEAEFWRTRATDDQARYWREQAEDSEPVQLPAAVTITTTTDDPVDVARSLTEELEDNDALKDFVQPPPTPPIPLPYPAAAGSRLVRGKASRRRALHPASHHR